MLGPRRLLHPFPPPGLGLGLAWLLACAPVADPEIELKRAVNALDERRYDHAREHLDNYLADHPDSTEAWRLAATAWRSGALQSVSRAIEASRRVLELEPKDQAAARHVVANLLFLGEREEASRVAKQLDDSLPARLLRARLSLDESPEEAAREIEAALADGGGTGELHALAAQAYRGLGEYERAVEHARRALELDPLDLQSTYLLARVLQRQPDLGNAGDLFETYQMLAQLQGAGSAEEPTTVAALKLLRDLQPRVQAEALPFRMELLRKLVENGIRDEATSLLSTIEELDPSEADRLELAGLANRLGDAATSRDQLSSVLESPLAETPAAAANHREAIHGLALLDMQAGELETARERLQNGLERFPSAARYHDLLGRIHLDDGNETEAERSFDRALHLAPWRSDSRIQLADLLVSQGRTEELAALLDDAPSPDPVMERYRRNRGL